MEGTAIVAGDTAWVLVSTALVMLMTPGLGFFYGGLVRGRNVLNTLMMSVVAMGVVALLWATAGYSLAFGGGNALVGGLEHVGLNGIGGAPREGTTVPHLVFMAFQMMFAVITPALISGAVVERMRFGAYVAFIALWSLLVYAPLAHWVWGGGWIMALGALDFAGGTVVHVSAGVSALVAAKLLGPRLDAKRHPRPHNVPFVLLGASLLWFGWFGFNAGSALAANELAGLALVTTNLGAAAAMCTWSALESWMAGKPSAVGAATGAVVGLVAITPAAGFVTPMASIAIGALAAVASYFAIQMMKRSGVDDSLDVFACHGIGGIVGSLLTGVFATKSVNAAGADGLLAGNAGLVWIQAVAVFGAAAVAAAATAVIVKGLELVMPVRATRADELAGLDLAAHAEGAYAGDALPGEPVVHPHPAPAPHYVPESATT